MAELKRHTLIQCQDGDKFPGYFYNKKFTTRKELRFSLHPGRRQLDVRKYVPPLEEDVETDSFLQRRSSLPVLTPHYPQREGEHEFIPDDERSSNTYQSSPCPSFPTPHIDSVGSLNDVGNFCVTPTNIGDTLVQEDVTPENFEVTVDAQPGSSSLKRKMNQDEDHSRTQQEEDENDCETQSDNEIIRGYLTAIQELTSKLGRYKVKQIRTSKEKYQSYEKELSESKKQL